MKNAILHIWPLFFLITVWLIFSTPYFLQGKVPFPTTYLATSFGPWNAYSNYTGPVKNNATPDVISQILPWKKLTISAWKTRSVPFWNPYEFSGTPLLANYQSAVFSPLNLLYFILPFINAWSLQILLQPLLAGIFMYIYIRSLKLGNPASLAAAISFMFCGFITTWMVYGTLGYAILFLPLALFAVEKFYDTKKWYYTFLLTLSIPLSFFSGHFQTSLYFLIFIFAYSTFRSILGKNRKIYIFNLSAIFFGILVSAPQLFPSIELYLNSVRSAIFAKTEVIPWGYLPTLIAPDIFGNPVTRNDWFGHYAEWNAYVGLIPLILAFFAFSKKKYYVLFFILSIVVVFLLAFQTPILDLLVAIKAPVLSTSAASRIIVLASFCLSVLCAFGLESLLLDITNKKIGKFAIIASCFLIIFAVSWVCAIFKIVIPADKATIAFSNLKLPTIIFAVFLVSVSASFIIKNNKTAVILSAVILFVVAGDLLRFSTKWQPFDPQALFFPNLPIADALKLPASTRVFGAVGQEAAMFYKFSGVEGYDPLYSARYGEFIEAGKDGLYHIPGRSAIELSRNGAYTGKIINFLGVDYIIHKISDGHAVWAFPFWTYPVDQFRTIYQDDKYQILKNDKAFPRAFFLCHYKFITDKKQILRTIFHNDLDLKTIAVLEQNPPIHLGCDMSALVRIEEYKQDSIKIRTNSKSGQILILTDPFYPGWKAFIDGSESKVYRADYAFRGVFVPGGEHFVTYKHSPDSFKAGIFLSISGIIGSLCLVFLSWIKYQP